MTPRARRGGHGGRQQGDVTAGWDGRGAFAVRTEEAVLLRLPPKMAGSRTPLEIPGRLQPIGVVAGVQVMRRKRTGPRAWVRAGF